MKFFTNLFSIVFGVIVFHFPLFGQTNYVSWDFTTSITSANYATNTTNQNAARTTALTNATLSIITLNGTGISGTSANTFLRVTGWPVSLDVAKYLEYSVTLTNGDTYQNSTLSLAISAQVSSLTTAANSYQVQYGWGSSPTFANATNGTVTGLTTSASSNTATIPAPGNVITTLLTIRILGYNTQGAGSGNIQIRTVALTASSAPLPVELISFTANAQGHGVELAWKTATEVNNAGFEIEKCEKVNARNEMGDGRWEKIGFVEGSGTTNAPKSYSYVDARLNGVVGQASAGGMVSYRLKQIDRDGKFEYSNTVEVKVGLTAEDFKLTQNYPNPFNPNTTITFAMKNAEHVNVTVYNSLGQAVATLFNNIANPNELYSLNFDGKNLASGTYFYTLRSASRNEVRKMLMMK